MRREPPREIEAASSIIPTFTAVLFEADNDSQDEDASLPASETTATAGLIESVLVDEQDARRFFDLRGGSSVDVVPPSFLSLEARPELRPEEAAALAACSSRYMVSRSTFLLSTLEAPNLLASSESAWSGFLSMLALLSGQ